MSCSVPKRGRAALVALVASCCAALAIIAVWQFSDGDSGEFERETETVLAPHSNGSTELTAGDLEEGVETDLTVERASIVDLTDDASTSLDDVQPRELAGLVLDADRGFAIEGATVELDARGRTGEQDEDGDELLTTDGDGRFHTTWRHTGEPRLAVRADGYRELSLPRVDFDAELVLRLERAAGLSVFVEDHGGADGDVEIVVHEMRIGGDQLSHAATSVIAPGTAAEFVNLAPGEFFVAASAPGTGVAFERVELAAGEDRRLNLVLPRGTGLSGQVTDSESGAPVADVEVSVRPSAQGVWSRLERRFGAETMTDENGRYAFEGLHPGEVVVQARAPWGSDSRRRLTLDPSLAVTEQDLRLASPASVAGVVRDRSGRPVGGAVVILSIDRVRGTVADPQIGANTYRRFGAVALTDEAGRYRIVGLPPEETLFVSATPTRRQDSMEDTRIERSDVLRLELNSGEAREGIDLQLMPTSSVHGRVVDSEGRPIEGVRLTTQRLGAGVRGSWAAGRSNEAGAYELHELVPGRYRIRAEHDDYLTVREEFEFADDDAPSMEIELCRASSVEVAVLDERGAAVPSANVELILRIEPDRLRLIPPDRSDRFGTAYFGRLAAGRYTVKANARDFEPLQAWDLEFDLDPEAVRYVEVVLRDRPRPPGASVVGTVEMRNGELARRVHFMDRRGGSLSVEDGRFRLSGARPGRARLVLRADDSMPHVTEDVLLVPGGELDLGAIELEPASRVDVFVVDQDGERVRDAQVRLRPLPELQGGRGEEAKMITPSQRRGQEGFFPRVPLCAWTVRVRHPDFHAHEERLVVDESRERVTITLHRR